MYTENDNKVVNILGTDYKIMFVPIDSKELNAKDADGYTDTTVKEIVVGIFEPDDTTVKDLSFCQRSIIRHEIVHAFLYESGLNVNSEYNGAWAVNEEVVDWIALQHNKLHAAFEKAGAL